MGRNGLFIIDLLSNTVGAFMSLFMLFAVLIGRTPPGFDFCPSPDQVPATALMFSAEPSESGAWVRLRMRPPSATSWFYTHRSVASDPKKRDEATRKIFEQQSKRQRDRHVSTIPAIDGSVGIAGTLPITAHVMAVQSTSSGRETIFVPLPDDGCWEFEVVASAFAGNETVVNVQVWFAGVPPSRVGSDSLRYDFDPDRPAPPTAAASALSVSVGVEVKTIHVGINRDCDGGQA